MPRKGASIAGVAALPGEDFLRVSVQPLSHDEREALRSFFASPLWQKVWKNALAGKPSAYVPDGNPPVTGILANNQLHRMQGWELFRLALASQIEETVKRPAPPKETYPEPLTIVTPKPL